MALRPLQFCVFLVFCLLSCSNQERIRDNAVFDGPFDMPPKQEAPVLRVINYKNRDEGAPLALWLRTYLDKGIEGVESLDAFRGSYVFIASMRSARQAVVDLWITNYEGERDFSRLVAERIIKRLDQDLPGRPPDRVYGPNYERAVKDAYQKTFWGGVQRDSSWAFALRIVQDEDAEPGAPQYWGFVLLSIPRETLEIQVHELLSQVSGSAARGVWMATKEQNAAFDHAREYFFEQF